MAEDIVGSKMPSFASDALREDKRGYGQNGFGGASSDHATERTCSDLAKDLEKSADDGENVLGIVQSRGITDTSPPDKQLRAIGAGNVKDAWTAKNPNADNPKVGVNPRPVWKNSDSSK